MINVNQITSILERLPDAALQQYAAMHKQDPYVLSLAVEESNRRKRMRAAPQQQQAPQPPINEQAVQAMAPAPPPEASGLAQLPAAQMEMADGGIVAFADAGAVSDRGYDPSAITGMMTPWSEIERRIRAGDPRAIEYTRTYMQNRIGGGAVPDSVRQLIESTPPPAVTAADARRADMYGPAPTAPAAPTASPRPAAPQPPAGGLGGLSASMSATSRDRVPAPAPTAITPPRSIEEAREKSMQSMPTGLPEDLERRLDTMRDTSLEAFNRNVAEYKTALAQQGKAGEGIEQRLKKEEEAAPQKREENLKMALINAGLGMLAGTSRYAAVNIGEGAKQGVQTYREGLKDLDKAAERRQELLAKLEEARRAEARGDAEKAFTLNQQAAALRTKTEEAKVEYLMRQTDMNRRDATAMAVASTQQDVQIYTTKLRIDAELQAAKVREAQANVRLQASLKSGDTQLQRTALIELRRSMDAQLRHIRDASASQYTKEAKADYKKQETDLLDRMGRVDQKLAEIGGLPESVLSGPNSAPAPGARTPDKFGTMTVK